MISETVKAISPETLVILDGVCSVASEEIRFDDWSIDVRPSPLLRAHTATRADAIVLQVVVGASQKGLGVPPGLSVVMASQAALKTLTARTSRVGAYYASWNKWLPIMQSYESPPAAYFATPPVQLIYALHASLTAIVHESPSLEARFAKHKEVSARVKDAVESWGLGLVPLSRDAAANGMCVRPALPSLRGSPPETDRSRAHPQDRRQVPRWPRRARPAAQADGPRRRHGRRPAQGHQGHLLPHRESALPPSCSHGCPG